MKDDTKYQLEYISELLVTLPRRIVEEFEKKEWRDREVALEKKESELLKREAKYNEGKN